MSLMVKNNPSSIKKLKQATQETNKGNYQKSIKLCHKIIKKFPNDAVTYKLLATNLLELNRFSEVEIALKKAISHCDEAGSQPLIHLLGCNYLNLESYKKALGIFEDLFNKTGDPKILLDIALSYFKLGDYESARDVYYKLLELDPDNHQAKFNLYPILIYFQDYKNAWTCFHSRIERQEMKDQLHWFAPAWNGESLVGKNILIYPEQGIGDNLSYTSCFSEAINDAKQAHIVCDNRLKGLYEYNFPNATIHSYQDVNKRQAVSTDLDLQILAGSLTYLYRTSAASFSNNKRLVISDKLKQQKNNYLSKTKLRIGLSWYHGKVNDGNQYSMTLEEMLPLLKIEGVQWINLQFGEWKKEVDNMQGKHNICIQHFDDCSAAGNFEDYGALIANLDLVISASNAALMLSTRLGVKSWMFLPLKNFSKEGQAFQDCLSFKGQRNFYKDFSSDWCAVINQFCEGLNSIIKRDVK
ncbi:MAG: tetratricopeptide repeat protein [Psychromonas sp.]|nr:tetratricopeptide repeat protein [Psychromonas sp.]